MKKYINANGIRKVQLIIVYFTRNGAQLPENGFGLGFIDEHKWVAEMGPAAVDGAVDIESRVAELCLT